MGEVFAFVSGLYFRGKLTYAQRFANVGDHPARTELGGGVPVITPGAGLRSADTHVNAEALRLFAQIDDRSRESSLPHAARGKRPPRCPCDRRWRRSRAARIDRVTEVR